MKQFKKDFGGEYYCFKQHNIMASTIPFLSKNAWTTYVPRICLHIPRSTAKNKQPLEKTEEESFTNFDLPNYIPAQICDGTQAWELSAKQKRNRKKLRKVALEIRVESDSIPTIRDTRDRQKRTSVTESAQPPRLDHFLAESLKGPRKDSLDGYLASGGIDTDVMFGNKVSHSSELENKSALDAGRKTKYTKEMQRQLLQDTFGKQRGKEKLSVIQV